MNHERKMMIGNFLLASGIALFAAIVVIVVKINFYDKLTFAEFFQKRYSESAVVREIDNKPVWTGEIFTDTVEYLATTTRYIYLNLDFTNTSKLDSEEKTIDGFVFMEVTKDTITKQFTRNEFLNKLGFDTTRCESDKLSDM